MTTPSPDTPKTPDERLLEILERIERRLDLLEGKTPPSVPEASAPEPVDGPPSEPEPETPSDDPRAESIEKTPPPAGEAPPVDESVPQPAPTLSSTLAHLRERKDAAREEREPAPKMRSVDEMQSVATGRAPASPPIDAPPPPPPPRAAPKPAPKPREPFSLERLIGGKAFMILGALIVVAGAAFFLKLAYDAGWHKLLSPASRCGLAALFGALLMGAGEAARRKLGAFAAIGFSAAGLGVLYATAYATSAIFDLVPVLASFWMLAGVCALGLFTGLRARSVFLTAIALAGGYLAPVIMGDPDAALWGLPAYLLALLVVGSGVSVLRPGQRILATIAWWGSSLLGTLWLVMQGEEAPLVAIAFVALSWLVAQLTQGLFTHTRHLNTLWRDLPVPACTGITLWSGAGLLLAAHSAPGVEQWWVMLALAVACALQGARLGHGIAFLKGPIDTVRARVGVAMITQGAALVPLVVFLALDAPWAQSLVWASLALASFVTAWRVRMPALVGYAIALLLIASARTLGIGIVGHEILAGDAAFLGLVWTP